jgi:hypothetical protein
MPLLDYFLTDGNFQRKNSIAARKSAMEFENVHSVVEKI